MRIIGTKNGNEKNNKLEDINKDLMRFSDEIINKNSLRNPEDLIKEIKNFKNFLKLNLNLCNYTDPNERIDSY
mgnify:CR=1 FL=1